MIKLKISGAILIVTLFMFFGAAVAGAKPAPAPPPTTTTPTTPTPTVPTSSGGTLGSPDTTVGLGMSDASCSNNTHASPEVVRNCASSGLAESAYPPANFGTDTNVDTGPLSFGNDLAAGIQNFISGFISLQAHILTWILEGLGLAFSFDLFAQDTGGHIAHGLNQTLNLFTVPLLPVAMVIGGIVAVYYWGVRRAEGQAVIHVVSMIALMGLAFLVASNPVGMLGWADSASNQLTNGTFAAFTGHTSSNNSGFADAVPGIYRTAMEEPWCAMEFGSVGWCMAPIDPAMATARRTVLAHIDQALGDQGTPELAKQEAPLERTRLNDARTNGELFLSFIPNANARNGLTDNWTLAYALNKEHPELIAIRGPGGAWEHMSILFLSSIAGLFLLLLLVYVAYQLVVASILFVVCLLGLPIAIFMPAFGDKGRAGFLKWFTWIFEALAKRVIFAAYLGIIFATTTVFISLTNLGWGLQWIVLAVIWAMAFHFRHRFLDLVSGGTYYSHDHPGHRIKTLATAGTLAYAWKRAPQKTQAVHEHNYGDTQSTHQHVHVYGSPYTNEGPLRVNSSYGELENNGEPPAILEGSASDSNT